jgi:uncharacterized damage-inducible protein DinB
VDITEIKATEEALRESRRLLQTAPKLPASGGLVGLRDGTRKLSQCVAASPWGARESRRRKQFRGTHSRLRSVRDTLVHILGGEWIWLAYWKEPSHSPAFLSDLRARRDALFNPDAFPNVAAVRLKWAEVEKEQAEFVNRVTNEALEQMLPFRATQIKLAHLMQHLANHSTYHRGQVALMIGSLAQSLWPRISMCFSWKAPTRLRPHARAVMERPTFSSAGYYREGPRAEWWDPIGRTFPEWVRLSRMTGAGIQFWYEKPSKSAWA